MRSLAWRLILAFLAVSLAGIAIVAVSAGQVTASEFGQFMFAQNRENLVAQLAEYYRGRGGWEGIDAAFPGGMMGGKGPGGMGGQHGMLGAGGFAVADANGHVVAAGGSYRLGDAVPASELANGAPIEVDGQVVGTLLPGHGMAAAMLTPAGANFLASVNRALALGALGATALALGLGVLLARSLTRPLRELTAGTRAVAAGDFGRSVPVRSHDELGQLAAAFNQMSADLARGRDLRRQMTADIAHELRTPLSLILGHAEALSDGVLPATPETFAVIHDEARRLNRLVDDLRTLSLAEAGELKLAVSPVDPGRLLERAAATYAPRAQRQKVALRTEIAADLPAIAADPDRIAQVLGNLLDNALRYTPAGGSITLEAGRAADGVQLAVRDTGAGISADDLPHVFDRFYRADRSRGREQGGSGLGLAIAKSLVEAHGGRLWVESRAGEGTAFFCLIPAAVS